MRHQLLINESSAQSLAMHLWQTCSPMTAFSLILLSCGLYLGLELSEAGHVANAFCGGRTPLVDTIDVSYTALVGDLSVPIGDGIGVDERDHPAEEFPFMAAP